MGLNRILSVEGEIDKLSGYGLVRITLFRRFVKPLEFSFVHRERLVDHLGQIVPRGEGWVIKLLERLF